MRLRGLQLHGFKSFADQTDIDFHEGLTAIVGPNGCGKSNISDAIRWVLGEQRPTAIRGAKMEEAIFQGSVNRRPVNRGSVRMTVSNEDGSLPVPYEEVEIGRTVYRDGGSDYFINRSPSRLKDVVDLCRDTGLGANAYSVIENRMIDAILSDRADERRSLFEEAAGIGKYKDRRKTAIRRLERAEADLERLEDLIGEVQRKVRSLARQKGKAERWQELRNRRLSVEVAVVRDELTGLAERLEEVDEILEQDERKGEGMVAQLRTAEAEEERLRLRQVEAEKARAEAASELEEVREELARWERDLAVAAERATYAERRLSQISDDRREARERIETLTRDAGTLSVERAEKATELEELKAELEARREESERVRERLTSARSKLEDVEGREREIARRVAQLEGDAESADAQAAELKRREGELLADLEEAGDALSELESQGDLFADRVQVLEEEIEAARARVEEARSAVEDAREELDEARRREREAEDEAGSLRARLSALRSMERDREGVEPVVRAVLDRGREGVLGTVTDFLTAPPELARAVELYLGPMARGIVVRDRRTVSELRDWFREEWSEGGGLVILPLDRAPEGSAGGTLLDALEVHGEGAPWVRGLLAGADLVDDGTAIEGGGGDRDRVTPSGAYVDRRGIVRVGNPGGATGVLERRSRIQELEDEVSKAETEAEKARRAREEAATALKEREGELEATREALREAEDRHREVRADAAAQTDRKERMDQRKDELVRQIEGTRAARARALERASAAREDRDTLLEEEESLREKRTEAREALDEVQAEWEEVRSEESRLAVQVTRLEGEVGRIQERIDDLEASRKSAERRVETLDDEEETLQSELEEARQTRKEGEEATEELFQARDAAEEDLRAKDAALTEVAEALKGAEQKVRQVRAAEREASDERHRLELERQELEGKIGRIQDRLEGEWGRSLEELVRKAEPVEGEPEELRQELREIVDQLERIGPVNMLAVEEHEEESARLEFLEEQRDDLVEARQDLRTAIKEINETAISLFMETFEEARANFRETFQRLFQGGEADLWLEDPEDPLESPIEIHASPVGKKTQRIDLLSGGERALTALSLLFGIYLVKPSPFCVLDEVDAPLDENNIGRFIRLLQDLKHQTQFVVITHNPRTIEAADWIYGVTMEEPGVSTVVGVQLREALEASGSAA
ncbi:MAG: chromosome segregation protein SMC [Longimicrobiales bacterium]|nr:chromosome segregation protein SMC [Longimicrobiales bacterium]